MTALSIKNITKRMWDSPTVTSWARYGAHAGGLGIVIPLVLNRFSTAEIAVYFLFLTITGLRMIADFGIRVTFTRCIAYSAGGAQNINCIPQDHQSLDGKPNFKLMLSITGTMSIIYRWLSFLTFIGFSTIGTIAVYRQIDKLDNSISGWIAWSVIVIITTIVFRSNQFFAFIEGNNYVALIRRWEAIHYIVGAIFSVVVILFGGNLLALVVTEQIVYLSIALIARLLSKTILDGWLKRQARLFFDRDIFCQIWPAIWRTGLGLVMAKSLVEISGIIYAQFASSSQVATILLAIRLIRTVSDFSQASYYSKLPLMARLLAQGNRNKLIAVSQRGMAISYWVFFLGWAMLGIGGDIFMELINSNAEFPPSLFWGLLGIGYLFERYGAMHLQLYSTMNQIIWHKANGYSGLIYLVSLTCFFPKIGIYALPVSVILSYLCFYTWYSALHSHKYIIKSFWKFEKLTFMPVLISSTIYLFMIIVFHINDQMYL